MFAYVAATEGMALVLFLLIAPGAGKMLIRTDQPKMEEIS